MANIRIGLDTEFNLNNNNLGINTTTPQERLDVAGVAKAKDLEVTGVSSFTAYEGFLRSDNQIDESINLEFGNGINASLSGEIIVKDGTTVTVGAVGLGTTSVGAGTHTIQSNIDTTDVNLAGGSQIECLKVFNTFTPPNGGTNERPSAPKPGQLYYNFDFKTIEFFDGYGWRQVDYTTRSGRSVWAGGYTDGNVRTKEMTGIDIPTLGNSYYFGDLARNLTTDGRGFGSAVRGVFAGGYGIQTPGGSSGRLDDIDYTTIASLGNAVDFGNLTIARNGLSAVSSSTRGIIATGASNQGSPGATNSTNVMEYVEISTLGNALDFGDLIKERVGSGGVNSSTRGIFGAGDDYHGGWQYTALGQLDYITMASKGNSVDFGSDIDRIIGAACGNDVRGCWAGGYITSQYSGSPASREAARRMTYVTISTFGNAIDFGNLTSGIRMYIGGASTKTRGIFTGGSQYPVHYNEIDYIQFSSLRDRIDFGYLHKNKG